MNYYWNVHCHQMDETITTTKVNTHKREKRREKEEEIKDEKCMQPHIVYSWFTLFKLFSIETHNVARCQNIEGREKKATASRRIRTIRNEALKICSNKRSSYKRRSILCLSLHFFWNKKRRKKLSEAFVYNGLFIPLEENSWWHDHKQLQPLQRIEIQR